MTKDPAVLLYIDTWLVATKEMKADCRGWYLNLILHQFDKKDLPNDIEELANLADVRVSEFERFKQVFEQVLQHKFKQNENGRLENAQAKAILCSREVFKDKREDAGRMSYFVKYVRRHLTQDENVIYYLKNNADISKIDIKNKEQVEQVFKQVLKQMNEQMSELYINEDKDINTTISGEGLGEGMKAQIANTLLIPEMMKVWKSVIRNYPEQKDDDYGACMRIAYKIADSRKWKRAEVTNGKMDETLKSWKKIAEFVNLDSFYKTLPLKTIENQWQGIYLKMCDARDKKNITQKPKVESPKGL